MKITDRINQKIRTIVEYRASYAMLAPFMIVFLTFTVFPVIASFALSFTRYNVFNSPVFVGIMNYTNLFFFDEVFQTAVRNTLLLALITGPAGYLLCFFLAWMINDLPHKVRSILTLIFYLPSIAGNVFAIWLIIFDGDIYGYLNSFLMRAGFIKDPVQWLNDPRYMMMTVIIVQLWISLGTSFLTMRAGFNTIDRQYYEASAVDGVKNRWQELWFVTVPIMTPHLMLSAVLSITAAFSSFHVASILTGFPSTNYATHTVMHHMIDHAYIRFDRGYASAVATLLFLSCYLLNILFQKLLRKVGR